MFLLRRAVPGTDQSCLLAAKRYRSAEHRLFHRDSQYLEGRRVRESRATRAMANRTAVGREMIAKHVWDENVYPYSNVIDVYVNRLRKKINHFGHPLLHTRRGEGFILAIAPSCAIIPTAVNRL